MILNKKLSAVWLILITVAFGQINNDQQIIKAGTTAAHGSNICSWIVAANKYLLKAPLPLFPIGGIDLTNVNELAGVGRAAVGSALMGAEDPGQAGRELRALLLGEG